MDAFILNMKVIMHSCGYIYDIMKDLVEAGVDVFQLDQLDIIGIKKLSYEFGGKVTFFSPVDVQNILPTGNKKIIQMFASDMINMLGSFNGGLIARDYGDYNSISVDDEWAGWAKEIFLSHSYN